MAKFYNEDGTEVEAFTQEEVDAKVQETNQNIEDLKSQLDQANKDLEELKNDDKNKNFENLRKSKKAAEDKVAELEGKINNEIGGLKNMIVAKELDQNIKVLADGDEELAKKIKLHYDEMLKPEDDEKKRNEKLGQAYVLATGGKPNNDVMKDVISGAGGPNKNPGSNKGFSPDLVGLGAKLGLSPEDFKKYGK